MDLSSGVARNFKRKGGMIFTYDFDLISLSLSFYHESGGGAMHRTNPDSLRSCLCFQVLRLNFLLTSLTCCLPDSIKPR